MLTDCPLTAALQHWTTAHLREHWASTELWPVFHAARRQKGLAHLRPEPRDGGLREWGSRSSHGWPRTSREPGHYRQALLLWTKAGLVDTAERRLLLSHIQCTDVSSGRYWMMSLREVLTRSG